MFDSIVVHFLTGPNLPSMIYDKLLLCQHNQLCQQINFGNVWASTMALASLIALKPQILITIYLQFCSAF